jgi:hypothetical protein
VGRARIGGSGGECTTVAAGANHSDTSFAARYGRGVRTSLRINAAAYGYSVTITSTFGVLSVELGTPGVGEVFLFLFGAVVAFTVVDAVVSRGFRERLRGEPPEVVALGSAFGFASAGLSVGAAAVLGSILATGAAWPLGSFGATATFLSMAGVEMGLAERLGAAGKGGREAPSEED